MKNPMASHPYSVKPLQSLATLIDDARTLQGSTVLIAGGDREEDLELVSHAFGNQIIQKAVLVGDKNAIHSHAKRMGVSLDHVEILHAENDDAIGAIVVQQVQDGLVDCVLKGGISTPAINRSMLKLAIRPTVSLTTLFQTQIIMNGKPTLLTDAGVTTVCNVGRMVDIIQNAIETAQMVMGIEKPRVAVLSANEKQIPSLPSTWLGLQLAKRNWPNAYVCGPLSFDLATDPDSVSIKGMPDLPHADKVAGQADILVCPGIDAANILYKTISALNKKQLATMAGITAGFRVPYIILSRADSLDIRMNSLALCSIYTHNKAFMHSDNREADEKPKRLLALLPDGQGAVLESGSIVRNMDIVSSPESLHAIHARTPVDAIVYYSDALPSESDEGIAPVQDASSLPEYADRETPDLPVPVFSFSPKRGNDTEPMADSRENHSLSSITQLHRTLVHALASQTAISIGMPVDQCRFVIVTVSEAIHVFAYAQEDIRDSNMLPLPATILNLCNEKDSAEISGELHALLYEISKRIGSVYVAAGIDVDAIICIGKLMDRASIRSHLRKRVGQLAPMIFHDESVIFQYLADKTLEFIEKNQVAG
jgi:phosphotransacetylase